MAQLSAGKEGKIISTIFQIGQQRGRPDKAHSLAIPKELVTLILIYVN